jgi:serine/threonine protein kinase
MTSSPQPPPLPPRYEPGALLGEGGMGRVWAARDTVLDVPVAVKVLQARFASRPGFLMRFHREVALQARLHHPNLVPLHDAGQTPDGQPFVAMALAELGSLARYLPQGLPWAQASTLADELLAALSALHARGVVHLDLKPENVLLTMGLDQRPHVWLADLGIARLMAEPGQGPRGAMGTPAFMPPEQRAGRLAELDRRSDLYAAGRILAQLVGRYDVPPGLDALLLGLCHPERLCRPDLAADVRLALDELGPAAAPLPPMPQLLSARAVTTWVTDVELPLAPVIREPEPFPASVTWEPWLQRQPPPPPALPPEETSGEASLRASLELYAHREIPIVGRDQERAALWRLARRCRMRGQPEVALVIGEAGAGKTRLVDSVMHALEEGGWAEALRIPYQRGAPGSSGMRGAAQQLVAPWGERESQTRDRLERWFRRMLPALPAPVLASMGAAAAHQAAPTTGQPGGGSWHRQLIQWVLEARCRRGLSAIVVEDAHLSEEPAEGLDIPLQLLNRSAMGQPAPLLIVCTLRSGALARSLELRRRVELLCDRGAVRIDVPRLDRAAMEQLLAGSLDLTPELRSVVAQRCEGNPLLARLLIGSWASQGMLEEVGDLMYTLAPGVDPAAAIPEDARSLFLDRALAAAAGARDREAFLRHLTMLALAGRDLPQGIFERLAGPCADELLASGLVLLRGGRYRFDHRLLHEVLREAAALREDLRGLYDTVAETWASYGRDSGEDVGIPQAEALLAAGHARAAFAPLARAAHAAWRQGRAGATRHLGEAALRAHEQAGLPDDHPGAAQATAVTAWAVAELPDLARAETLAQRALAAALRSEDRAVAGAVLGNITALRGDWPRARRLLEDLLQQLGDPPLLPPLETLARAALVFGEGALAADAAERALGVVQRDASRAARLLRLRAQALALQGALPAALHAARRAVELATGEIEPALALHCLAGVTTEAGLPARDELKQAEAALASVGGGGWSQEVQQARAEQKLWLGELDEARRLLGTVAQWGELRRVPMEVLRAQAALCLVELEAGDHQAAAQAAEAAERAASQQAPVPWLRARVGAASALATVRQGRWGPALDLIDRLRNRGLAPADRATAELYRQLALEAERHGQRETATWLGERAAEVLERS